MEVILIPKVGLSDANGRDIGIYSDNPSWWQKLKQKHSFQNGTSLDDDRQITPINEYGSNGNMKTNLIKADEVSKKFDEESIIISNTIMSKHKDDYFKEECNVIGETPLHIAIMYDDLTTLKILVEKKGYDVNQRNLEGKFYGGFSTKESSKLINQSNYDSLAYYGEYPLAFAACFANKEIYDYLIEKGANPNLQG